MKFPEKPLWTFLPGLFVYTADTLDCGLETMVFPAEDEACVRESMFYNYIDGVDFGHPMEEYTRHYGTVKKAKEGHYEIVNFLKAKIKMNEKEKKKMTCREKLKIEHPEFVNSRHCGGCRGCPNTYGYLPRSKTLCGGHSYCVWGRETCTKCWDQEVEEPTTNTTAATETYNYRAYAKHLRMKYEALIEAGFNEDQAMQLVPMWFDD